MLPGSSLGTSACLCVAFFAGTFWKSKTVPPDPSSASPPEPVTTSSCSSSIPEVPLWYLLVPWWWTDSLVSVLQAFGSGVFVGALGLLCLFVRFRLFAAPAPAAGHPVAQAAPASCAPSPASNEAKAEAASPFRSPAAVASPQFATPRPSACGSVTPVGVQSPAQRKARAASLPGRRKSLGNIAALGQ